MQEKKTPRRKEIMTCVKVDSTERLIRHSTVLWRNKTLTEHSKWMGMGTSRFVCRKASSASCLSSLLFYFILAAILFHFGTARRSCQVNGCIRTYRRAAQRVDVPEGETARNPGPNLRRLCRATKRYRRCLRSTHKACRGNLLFHSVERFSQKEMKKWNCHNIRKGRRPPEVTPSQLPVTPDPKTPLHNITAPATLSTDNYVLGGDITEGSVCAFRGKPIYKHCGMFGDPHLRTFSDEFFTCKVGKTWPLIDNNFIVVMATNVPVTNGSSATATTKITVLIKDSGECAGQRYYSATSANLPRAFVDGTTNSGSVYIEEKSPGQHVVIRAGFIGTTIVIRRVQRFLTFAIRMPQEYIEGINSRQQLCVQGCPLPQRISTSQYLKTMSDLRAMEQRTSDFSEDAARAKCKEILLAVSGDGLPDHEEDVRQHRSNIAPPSSALASSVFSSLQSRTNNRNSRMAPASRVLSSDLESKPLLEFQQTNRRSKRRKGKKRRNRRRKSKRAVSADVGCAGSIPLRFNFYFDSCVFDLVTTGDVNFTLIARAALDDVHHMHARHDDAPGASMEVIRRWNALDERRESPNCRKATELPSPSSSTISGGTVAEISLVVLLASIFASHLLTTSFTLMFFNTSSDTVNRIERRHCAKTPTALSCRGAGEISSGRFGTVVT